YGTFEVTIDGARSDEVEMLVEMTSAVGLFAEDWSTNIRVLCRACSEGRPFDDKHKHDHDPGTMPDRRVAIAAQSEDQVQNVLKLWREKVPQAEIIEVNCVLAPALVN